MVFLYLICSILRVMSLIGRYAQVSLQSIDCILCRYLTLNAILLTSSRNTSCFSHTNHFCDSNINLFFSEEFFVIFFYSIYFNIIFLNSLFHFQKDLLPDNFYNLRFFFWSHLFVPFAFYFHY